MGVGPLFDFFFKLLDTEGFPARWSCGSGWTTELGVLHIASDVATFVAYVSIPALLGLFYLRRRDFPFPRVGWLFAAFILSCGIGHLIEALLFYHPVYRLAGLAKLLTALVSVATALAMVRVVPQVLALRSPAQFEAELAKRLSEIEGLRQETRRLEILVESSPEGVALIQPGGRVRFANASARSLLEEGEESEAGHLSPVWTAALEKAAKRGRITLTQGERTVSLTTFPVASDPGATEGEVALLLADETETQLLNQRLIRQARELQAASADLDAYAFTISHDLRAPLRQISGFADQIERHQAEQLGPEARENLACIQQATGRLRLLTDSLLRFARGGQSKLRIVSLDLQQLVSEVSRELGRDAAGPIEWEIGPLPQVQADVVLLRQVVRNLLENALKFSREGEPPRITVRAEPGPGQVWIHVQDRGVGFESKRADQVFNLFQRLDHDEDYAGSGVGLAIVKRIVTRHGGEVMARGEVGVGATFSFSLPHEATS